MPDTLPLMPSQAWFLTTLAPSMLNPDNWGMAAVYRLPAEVSAAVCRDAVQAVWRHHDALRLRIVEGFRQAIEDAAAPPPFRAIDMSRVPAEEVPAEVGRLAAEALNTLSIAAGPLVRFFHLRLRDREPTRLVVATHHLVADGWSYNVLHRDLNAAFRALLAGEPVRLGTSSRYEECVRAVVGFARSEELGRELQYWRSQPWHEVAELPVDAPDHSGDSVRSWRSVRCVLGGDDAVVLRDRLPAMLGVSLESIVLAAVSETLTAWSGGGLAVRRVLSGRNLTRPGTGGDARAPVLPERAWRTMGWFATAAVVVLPPRGTDGVAGYLRRTASLVEGAPNGGVGMNLLRWCAAPEVREALTEPWSRAQVLFGYERAPTQMAHGQGLVTKAERPPPHFDMTEARLPLHVGARLDETAITVRWDHDPTVRHTETVSAIADRCREVLSSYAVWCRDQGGEGDQSDDADLRPAAAATRRRIR